MDAAINYLHQRRLFKATAANLEAGLSARPGEGFLHRKRWNPERLGLTLDLIDPFKFADREKLLEAILDASVNWREVALSGSIDTRHL
jgi:CRISPR/Cas system-associated endonuclease Cas1